MRLKINDSTILWPGKIKKKPEGIMIPTHLKVLTIEEKPFVYVRKMTDDEIDCEDDEIPCPHFNTTDGSGKLMISGSHLNTMKPLSFVII
jgi:glutamate receptor ionotropic, NMDA 1